MHQSASCWAYQSYSPHGETRSTVSCCSPLMTGWLPFHLEPETGDHEEKEEEEEKEQEKEQEKEENNSSMLKAFQIPGVFVIGACYVIGKTKKKWVSNELQRMLISEEKERLL